MKQEQAPAPRPTPPALDRLARRGLLTAAIALGAAAWAKLTGAPTAHAGHNTNIAYDSQTTMHLDVTNTTAGSTRISSNISGTAAFVALNNYPVGISRPDGMLGRTMYTTSNCAGVAGTCEAASGGNGVMGAAKATNGCGVYGFAGSVVPSTPAPAGTGVYGSGPNTGMVGQSNNGVGVQGSSNANSGVVGSSNNSVGVYASSGTQYGLYATSPDNYAAVCTSNTGTAVNGQSNSNVGVLGTSNSSIGVFGSSTTGTGVYGTGPAAGFAGRFDGPVQVTGAFTVIGGPKSAAVPHPDGSYRRLYCVESPESWFEDFGSDQLVNGRARVRPDPDFNALVKADNYEVFLTPYGDTKGLYVSDKNANSFEVREVQGGTGSLKFCYRIVSKRRDIPAPRLEKVEVPAAYRRPAPPVAPPAVPPVPVLQAPANPALADERE